MALTALKLATFAFVLGAACSSRAELLENGSFEAVSIALADNQICTTNSAVYPYAQCSATAWSGNYQVGRDATIGRSGVSFGIPQLDPDGRNALILQSYFSVAQPSATEVINVVTPGSYAIRFFAANRGSPAGNTGPQTLSVLWDGAVIAGGVFDALPTAWTKEVLTVDVTAGVHSLTFAGLVSAPSDVTAFVDAVSIAAVPEPNTAAFLLAGLLVIALWRPIRSPD